MKVYFMVLTLWILKSHCLGANTKFTASMILSKFLKLFLSVSLSVKWV